LKALPSLGCEFSECDELGCSIDFILLGRWQRTTAEMLLRATDEANAITRRHSVSQISDDEAPERPAGQEPPYDVLAFDVFLYIC